jgi:hypothetical protein
MYLPLLLLVFYTGMMSPAPPRSLAGVKRSGCPRLVRWAPVRAAVLGMTMWAGSCLLFPAGSCRLPLSLAIQAGWGACQGIMHTLVRPYLALAIQAGWGACQGIMHTLVRPYLALAIQAGWGACQGIMYQLVLPSLALAIQAGSGACQGIMYQLVLPSLALAIQACRGA